MLKVNEELTKLDEAFPANALEYMPKYEEIPKYEGRSALENLASRWCGLGLHDVQFVAKEGVPGAAAFRQINCIMRSFAPKHEHKIAAVAYLIHEWFDVTPTKSNPSAQGTT